MVDIGIMVEGQNGLNWERWQRMAQAVEDLGFYGLYRSDHYTNAKPPDLDSLELWVSLTWLASHTARIQFGQLVSPLSFREPTMTARMAIAIDDLSDGRFNLGLGAGWQEREHAMFGWDLLSIPERFNRFEEGLQVITELIGSASPVTFDGEYYQVREAQILPHPKRVGGPPIVIGGNGQRRTLPLVASYASEWNAVYIPKEKFSELSNLLDSICAEIERDPKTIARSLMTGFFFGRTEAEIKHWLGERNRTPAEAEEIGIVIGTVGEVVKQIGALEEAGVQRLMLQWLDLDDLDRLEEFAVKSYLNSKDEDILYGYLSGSITGWTSVPGREIPSPS